MTSGAAVPAAPRAGGGTKRPLRKPIVWAIAWTTARSDERLGVISGDERKVKQVLLNLLSNALKFTPEGGRIDVGARLHDQVAEVSVADTGIGIAPADQDAVFVHCC